MKRVSNRKKSIKSRSIGKTPAILETIFICDVGFNIRRQTKKEALILLRGEPCNKSNGGIYAENTARRSQKDVHAGFDRKLRAGRHQDVSLGYEREKKTGTSLLLWPRWHGRGNATAVGRERVRGGRKSPRAHRRGVM